MGIESGAALEPLLIAGAEVWLGAGVHAGGLRPTASWSLLGEPGAVLRASGQPVVQVDADDLDLRLEDLEITGGTGEMAGGVALAAWSRVLLRRCRIHGCRSKREGMAGGVALRRGEIRMEECRFWGNAGRLASDMVVSGIGKVYAVGCHFAGDIRVREGASLTLIGCTVEGGLWAWGSTTRRPNILLRRTEVLGGIQNDAALPALIEVEP